MKSLYKLLLGGLVISTAACATPTVTLENHKSGQVQTCGGGTAGSWAGGLIGYSIQRNSDTKCIDSLKAKGFKVEDVK